MSARDRAPLVALGDMVRPVALAHTRRLELQAGFDGLLPEGIQRGTIVAVTAGPGGGATSVALALAARPARAAGWVAAVGLPGIGLVAAVELGLSPERFVAVNCPQRSTPEVVAALVDGFNVVLIGPCITVARDARRLAARVRERDAVLIVAGGDLPASISGLRLQVSGSVWDGIRSGDGHLRRRRLTVEATGRGTHAGRRRDELVIEPSLFGPTDGPVLRSMSPPAEEGAPLADVGAAAN